MRMVESIGKSWVRSWACVIAVSFTVNLLVSALQGNLN